MPTISPEEYAWREWFLGRDRFRKHGRRNPTVRHLTGAPARIPRDWWIRLDAFLTEHDIEPARKVPKLKVVRAVFPRRRADGAVFVSDHFRVSEFNCHDGRVVPKIAVPALATLAELVLEPIRDRFGSVFVTSGYRPRDYNARIGGARYSQHIYELTPESVAADLIPREGTPAEWALFARDIARRKGIGGVGRYDRSGFVHVDNGPRRDWNG